MFICIKFLDIETNKKTEVNNMIEIVGRIEGEVKLSDEKAEKSVKISKEILIKEISEIEELVRHPKGKMELEILKAWVFNIYGIRLQEQEEIIGLYFTPESFWRKIPDVIMKDNIKVHNMLSKIIEDEQKNNRIKRRKSI